MKVHRLSLRSYRGIAERELLPAPVGVTIVSGPNEAGKSSFAEALELLLDERDSTTKQHVRDVQPVDRDTGAEVEAEIELGPYRFTYAKRFHRRPETRLAISAPRVENHTGREAHERVQALLAEQVDVALWRALRLVQGEPLVQPALHASTSLAEALDRAAGVGGGGERVESLFAAAQAAFDQHYTATGRPRSELRDLEGAAEKARGEEARLAAELEALERDTADEEWLRRRVSELEAQIAAARAEAVQVESGLEEVRGLREECSRLEAQRETARARLDSAVQRARQRGQLVSAHAGAAAEVESLAEALESEEPALIAAGAELRHVEERLEAARGLRSGAAERAAGMRRDASLLRAEAERDALHARRERVAHERAEQVRVREVLAGPPLDLATVRAIESAQSAVERAQTRLATEGPSVQLDPEVALELRVDGHRVSLTAGELLERRVSESLVLELPGVGQLRVVAGAGAAEQRKILEQAETTLRGLCMEAGVEDHADALRILAARRSASEEFERIQRRLAEALAGASEADLETRERALAQRAARLRAARPGAEPLPDSIETAERALDEAEAADAEAREALDDLGQRRDAVAVRFQRQQDHGRNTRNRLELAQRNRSDLETRLASARSEAGDEELEQQRERCGEELEAGEASAREAAAQLAAREPERLETRAAELREAIAQGERTRREERDTLLRVRERLELAGERGLFDALQRAQRDRARAEHAWTSRRRRAEAAARLFGVLREERDAARSHYAAPLAEEIARLGRPLFGADFDVELDAELRVSRRILDGLDLGESQLSAGAREQLALLARLAAARIAGGVPLWIDDALGHTDAARLDALGPLVAAAAEASQVVVLTCAPERFRSLPAARVVELD